jgi:hypothetical protein
MTTLPFALFSHKVWPMNLVALKRKTKTSPGWALRVTAR